MNSGFIPVFTSISGSCLTMENWQELNIHDLSFYLDALLMKPGFALLNALPNLRSYYGWSGTLSLNASMLAANSAGIYTLRSNYDGSQLSINHSELYLLISKLEPIRVILPPGFLSYLVEEDLTFPEKLSLFVPASEGSDSDELGIYLVYNESESFADLCGQVQQFAAKPLYLSGDFSYSQAQELIAIGANWLESDKPASDALLGQIYDKDVFNLIESESATQFIPLSANCSCPTCNQKLTRAYLHHLFLNTPFLCQRFLIQHNAHYYKERIKLRA